MMKYLERCSGKIIVIRYARNRAFRDSFDNNNNNIRTGATRAWSVDKTRRISRVPQSFGQSST